MLVMVLCSTYCGALAWDLVFEILAVFWVSVVVLIFLGFVFLCRACFGFVYLLLGLTDCFCLLLMVVYCFGFSLCLWFYGWFWQLALLGFDFTPFTAFCFGFLIRIWCFVVLCITDSYTFEFLGVCAASLICLRLFSFTLDLVLLILVCCVFPGFV